MSSLRFSFTDQNISHLGFKLLYLAASKYEGEWLSNLHTHHFTELYFITKGKGEFQVENERFPVKENDLIIVSPHIEHTEFSDEEMPLEYVAISMEGMVFEFDRQFAGKNYAVYNCESLKENLSFLLKMLLEEAEKESQDYAVICQNLAEILVIYLMRRQKLSLHQSVETKMSKECGVAKRYIDSNYMENITLDLLAELTHMNKFYLVHSFTKYTGLSPINYLAQRRIQVSLQLLSSTDYSVAQIASSVGFSSQSYFSQVFRKELGVTPVQYRKQQMKKLTPLKNEKE